MADAKKGECTIRTRKFLVNRLLNRKQFILDVIHQGRPNVSRTELREKLAKMYKVSDDKLVVVYGLRTAFGGGKSTGFGLIYDNIKSLQEFEPKYRLVRNGLAKRVETTRKQRKERKNKALRVHGTDKAVIRSGGALKKKDE
eukprot:TRINITY_DN0_c0_g1_i2.p1 TRINITY_DN0_c0_g1~~TRINITY_DN0_c0_g1_i2.p1  ORF type:complete len:142 (-),score=47.49 TRINITY_DN0_c0_g1_i2:101-526(-)